MDLRGSLREAIREVTQLMRERRRSRKGVDCVVTHLTEKENSQENNIGDPERHGATSTAPSESPNEMPITNVSCQADSEGAGRTTENASSRETSSEERSRSLKVISTRESTKPSHRHRVLRKNRLLSARRAEQAAFVNIQCVQAGLVRERPFTATAVNTERLIGEMARLTSQICEKGKTTPLTSGKPANTLHNGQNNPQTGMGMTREKETAEKDSKSVTNAPHNHIDGMRAQPAELAGQPLKESAKATAASKATENEECKAKTQAPRENNRDQELHSATFNFTDKSVTRQSSASRQPASYSAALFAADMQPALAATLDSIIRLVATGEYDCDIQFLLVLKKTIKRLERYEDPLLLRLGIQLSLCKRYVTDYIRIRKALRAYTRVEL